MAPSMYLLKFLLLVVGHDGLSFGTDDGVVLVWTSQRSNGDAIEPGKTLLLLQGMDELCVAQKYGAAIFSTSISPQCDKDLP